MAKPREVEQVWECDKGHTVEAPIGIKYECAWCGTCGSWGLKKNRMKLVQVRSVNGRMVAA